MIEHRYQIACVTGAYFDVINPTSELLSQFPIGSIVGKSVWPAVHRIIKDAGYVFSSEKNAYAHAPTDTRGDEK